MKDVNRKEFGARLRRLRKARRLVAKDVAKAVGISESAILCYENGLRMPDVNLINKLADFFDVTVDFLINENEKEMNELKKMFDVGGLTYQGIPLSDKDIERVEEYLRFVIKDKLYNQDNAN